MFPPLEGGLPGHTDRLAASLASNFQVTVVTSIGVETDRPFRVVDTVGAWKSARQISRAVDNADPSAPILWQYVPHMYGRGGVNLGLSRVFRELRAAGRRQVALVHEIAAPFSWWPHRSWYALAHRLMWRGLVSSMDGLGISTAGWLERLNGTMQRPDRLFLAPSPSNLAVHPVKVGHQTEWRARHGLDDARRVLGYFGTVGAGKQFEWVLEAWRASRRREPATALVVIGAKPSFPMHETEARWFRSLGYQEDRDASEALQGIDVLALPFVDGVSERRSSFMTGLAHGCAVMTTLGPATGTALRRTEFFRGVSVEPAEFASATAALVGDEAESSRLGRAARKAYSERYDWPHLTARLIERLRS
ncbi:MAG: glycosyltransferase family 4 protein [Verrucomicrobiales bacterium]|nr:glycosyltransferase family 4 protein [Verrucomicrobiales bacterium]